MSEKAHLIMVFTSLITFVIGIYFGCMMAYGRVLADCRAEGRFRIASVVLIGGEFQCRAMGKEAGK